MSTKNEIWRLLEPGVDVWQVGDWVMDHGDQWMQVRDVIGGLAGRTVDAWDGRRRMTLPEPQGWISVKERMPTKEDADDNGWVLWMFPRSKTVGWYPWDSSNSMASASNWMSVPAIPQDKKDPDEEAWEEWSKKNLMRNYSVGNAEADAALKEGFMAGRKSVATDGGSHG